MRIINIVSLLLASLVCESNKYIPTLYIGDPQLWTTSNLVEAPLSAFLHSGRRIRRPGLLVHAETRFHFKRLDDQQEMFDYVVNGPLKESLRTVLDLITDPPEEDPY